MQRNENLIDLVKSFQNSNEYLVAKFGFNTEENESSKVGQLDRLSWTIHRRTLSGDLDIFRRSSKSKMLMNSYSSLKLMN